MTYDFLPTENIALIVKCSNWAVVRENNIHLVIVLYRNICFTFSHLHFHLRLQVGLRTVSVQSFRKKSAK